MKGRSLVLNAMKLIALLGLIGLLANSALAAAPAAGGEEIPFFKLDPDWPKTLPNAWITGNIGAIYIDKKDHVWIAQRPNSTTGLGERYLLDGTGDCCTPAPPVMEFDMQGNLLQSWGPIHINDKDGKTQILVGKQVSPPYPQDVWPTSEHGIYVDHKDNVWVTSQFDPSQVSKFSHDGKFLMRIGKREATSTNDKENFAGPAGVYVDPKSNEVFVADGYRNRRIIVFDADTGAFKRQWGAYGKPPMDPQQLSVPMDEFDMKKRTQQFAVVHCLLHSNDDLLYVCDRGNGRIQVFKKDGTFVREAFVFPRVTGLGTVYALAFSPDPEQKFIYVGDGSDKKIFIMRRSDMKILGSFGAGGRGPGQFLLIHAMATDSQGNLYVGETIDNNRVQRFLYQGMKPVEK